MGAKKVHRLWGEAMRKVSIIESHRLSVVEEDRLWQDVLRLSHLALVGIFKLRFRRQKFFKPPGLEEMEEVAEEHLHSR